MSTDALHIMLVEDNPDDAQLIQEMLIDAALEIADLKICEHLASALEQLKTRQFDIILLDLSLPDSQGLQTIQYIFEHSATLPIVVLTGNCNEAQANQAVKLGAQDYLLKDQLNGILLSHAIRYAIERQQLMEELRDNEQRYRGLFEGESDAVLVFDAETFQVEDANQAMRELLGYTQNELIFCGITQLCCTPQQIQALLVDDIQRKERVSIPDQALQHKDGTLVRVEISLGSYRQSGQRKVVASMRDISERLEAEAQRKHYLEQQRQTLFQTVEVMALTLEKRDPYTAGHQKRVAKIATIIATQMGWSSQRIQGLYLGGLIHDIGKIYIPAEILNRSGVLSKLEMKLIRSHPQVGYDIVKEVKFPWPVAEMVRQHQERYDGSGYPLGLKGNEILPEGHILGVADVIEAMVSHRPYRPAKTMEATIEEVHSQRGLRYAPEVVDAVLSLYQQDTKIFILDN
ncbi:response regulator [Candidatus Venteria ishoeyi]|uniref:HD domain-containing phosphohydrolase n=1 Tax=Candidatus Venteria ishoeyi TaxID=1899563 RepID=UPI0025A64CEC|nr:HD domain-containing phosphohydrolase [Candidatus Venteria ishoeyi]MDM8548134.1 response regulator [Candidatus Venteria ishoeyi]